MDEPLSALGDDLKFQIIPFLKSVSEQFGIPFLFISHSLVEMRLMVDKVLVVAGGRIAEQTTTDALARSRMGLSPVGYINLLKLASPRRLDGLFAYKWGREELLISAGNDEAEAIFELSSKDIILFKQHPEAISARNLFKCTVANTFAAGNRIGAELVCRRKNVGRRDDETSRCRVGGHGGVRTLCGVQGVCLPASRLKATAIQRTRCAVPPEDRALRPSDASLITHCNYLKSQQ